MSIVMHDRLKSEQLYVITSSYICIKIGVVIDYYRLKRQRTFAMQETTETHFTKSTQLTFYYKEFKFRNNSIASNQISQSNNINEDNFNEQFTSFDLMDFLPNNSINVESTQYQMNEQINVYQTNKKQEWVRIFEMNIF